MRQLLCWLLAVVLLACGQNGPAFPPLKTDATIVFFGDSLTYGTGAGPEQDMPSLVAKELPFRVQNAGVPGNTTQDGLNRLEETLNQPIDLLIIGLGGNDFLRHIPLAETKRNLKQMIHLAKAKGVRVLLMAIPQPSLGAAAFGNLSDHPVYEEIAEEERIELIHDVFTKVLSNNATKSDQIHPNAKGYALVKDQLITELRRLGLIKN
jgi:acyl-CoA hydrolase